MHVCFGVSSYSLCWRVMGGTAFSPLTVLSSEQVQWGGILWVFAFGATFHPRGRALGTVFFYSSPRPLDRYLVREDSHLVLTEREFFCVSCFEKDRHAGNVWRWWIINRALFSWSFILTREEVLLAISVIIKSIWEGNKKEIINHMGNNQEIRERSSCSTEHWE